MGKCRETLLLFFWLLFCGGCYKYTETLLLFFWLLFCGVGMGDVLYFKSTVKVKKLLVSKKGDIFLTQIQFSIDSCEISGDYFRWHLLVLYCESVSFSLRQFLQFY